MAPIKFEDNLKEKLEQRRLQPSTNAWEKLNNKLETNQTKRSNKSFWWVGIAASFVGILIVASVFFKKDDTNTIEQNIVDIEDFQKQKTIDKMIIEDKIEEQVVLENPKNEPEAIKLKMNAPKKSSELKIQLQQKQKELIKETSKEVVAQVEIESKSDVKENAIVVNDKLSFEDLKIKDLVAQVQELKKINNTVSDAEINALLDQAQKDIALHKLYNETTKKVDANALLQSVEDDLEQSFRDKAFKAIKSGYYYVKTSVTERNN